ncbi:MAG: MlaE family lipid ABC transporter permease subunit [Xanthobacteraceae bacterium]
MSAVSLTEITTRSSAASAEGSAQSERVALAASGAWTAERAGELEKMVDAAAGRYQTAGNVDIDLQKLESLDTFGAWLIERLKRALSVGGATARIVNLSDTDRTLFDEVQLVHRDPAQAQRAPNSVLAALDSVGRAMAEIGWSLMLIAHLLGALAVAFCGTLRRPRRLRLTSIVYQLDRVGWRAVPIIVLSTFLIGATIAQQGIFRFRPFGADIYVVDMVAILVLREVGVLIVSIMVAGRSGSAYTAELGAMKMREEIDALRTMGIDPVEILVLPRVIALIIAVPLLTFIGSMAALYGAGLVCWLYGGISPDIFLGRLRESVWLSTFAVGLIKAPFMALVIGVVACAEGFEVDGSTASLGLKTTASVVKSIFLVIVLDGFFAMFFAAIGL